MQRFLDAANALTIAALIAAFGCVILAINGHTGLAFVALIVSGLADLFDGFVARKLARDEQQKKFGGVLDSLVDGCAFGFAPSVMLYCAGMTTVAELLILMALPVCVVWRVAYFEVVGMQPGPPLEPSGPARPRYYTGLPATYVALALPAAALFGFIGATWFRWAVAITVVLVSVAMVSSLKVRRPGAPAYAVFVVLASAVMVLLSIYGGRLPNRTSSALDSSASVVGSAVAWNPQMQRLHATHRSNRTIAARRSEK
jgi:CDP-diacylglycerol--serine O-phosphatidyltransferase